MNVIASRDLRNDTAGVLRRVEAGEQLTVTSNGRAIAQLVPIGSARRSWLPRAELVQRLRHHQADPGLTATLRDLLPETTDDLGPVS